MGLIAKDVSPQCEKTIDVVNTGNKTRFHLKKVLLLKEKY